ncbi:hypothetical protein COLO4_32849 [Corchorus olitorius]|uniref:Uncharacterized protein n=1 Tax=Corchorus olitorius TaxID=93759 RepID=A0A1R3GY06_9ROSI|nr:hypothetical protein COLO4_32849 [Corchorus olitorius]
MFLLQINWYCFLTRLELYQDQLHFIPFSLNFIAMP